MRICIAAVLRLFTVPIVRLHQTGVFKENMMATVGFNMHKVQKGKVSSRAVFHHN